MPGIRRRPRTPALDCAGCVTRETKIARSCNTLHDVGPMKLLFDQNLSHKLVALLAVEFPGSAHVRDFRMSRASDPAVWSFAASREFVIV